MLHSKVYWPSMRRTRATLGLLSTAFVLSACADSGGLSPTALLNDASGQTSNAVTSSSLSSLINGTGQPAVAQSTVSNADEKSIIANARQLRLAGKKAKALKTLDDADAAETSASLIKERGMLALELGQLEKAEKLLVRARNDHAPDWRVLSALGATFSARGDQQAAQLEFSKALKLAPDHPSVLNNLALSYALDGNHAQAEQLLRRASSQTINKTKTKQNLALLLGLNGNIQESRSMSSQVLTREMADANASYFSTLQRKAPKVSKAELPRAQTIQSAQATTPSTTQ